MKDEPNTLEDYGCNLNMVRSATELQRINILIRRFNTIEALECYKINRARGVTTGKDTLQGRLISYFLELQAMFQRRLKKEDYDELLRKCFKSKNDDEMIEALFKMNIELDIMGLTRVDNIQEFKGEA